jgi:hypothetical protein
MALHRDTKLARLLQVSNAQTFSFSLGGQCKAMNFKILRLLQISFWQVWGIFRFYPRNTDSHRIRYSLFSTKCFISA